MLISILYLFVKLYYNLKYIGGGGVVLADLVKVTHRPVGVQVRGFGMITFHRFIYFLINNII